MGRHCRLMIVAAALLGSGCAVVSNRSYTAGRFGMEPENNLQFWLRVENAGPVNAACRTPWFIPFVVYAEYQGPPFSVTLNIADNDNRLEQIRIQRVSLVLPNGELEDVPVPQAFCTLRQESGARRASLPVVENLKRHEALELRIDAVLRAEDGTQTEVQMSAQLVPEKRQGATDAVTFTAFGIT